jgi:hypothetical protein
MSVGVEALPSSHVAPSAFAGLEQTPVPVAHTPARWHESLGVQMTGLEPVHDPVWHVSLCVHAFPSSHTVPFAAFGFEHVPVAGLHVPATWH